MHCEGVLQDQCDPMVCAGGVWYTCFSDSDVTTRINSDGTLEVGAIGSSSIGTVCSYEGYTLYARFTLTTLMLSESWEGGTTAVATSGFSHTFTSLDSSGSTPYFLTVEILPTDMDGSSEYANVYVNDQDVGKCDPDSCGSNDYYTCFADSEVTYQVSFNGDLEVGVIGQDTVNDAKCEHGDYTLYGRFTLSTPVSATPAPSNAPTITPTSTATGTPHAAPTPAPVESSGLYSDWCAAAEHCWASAQNNNGEYIKCDMCV